MLQPTPEIHTLAKEAGREDENGHRAHPVLQPTPETHTLAKEAGREDEDEHRATPNVHMQSIAHTWHLLLHGVGGMLRRHDSSVEEVGRSSVRQLGKAELRDCVSAAVNAAAAPNTRLGCVRCVCAAVDAAAAPYTGLGCERCVCAAARPQSEGVRGGDS